MEKIESTLVFVEELSNNLDKRLASIGSLGTKKIILSVKLLCEAIKPSLVTHNGPLMEVRQRKSRQSLFAEHAVPEEQRLVTSNCEPNTSLNPISMILEVFTSSPEGVLTGRFAKRQEEPIEAPAIEPSRLLWDSIIESGWCPLRLSALCSKFRLLNSIMLYLLDIPPCEAIGHSRCGKKMCHADTQEYYIPGHEPQCSPRQCDLIEATLDKFLDIYKQSEIPVILRIEASDGKLFLDVIPRSRYDYYIAISHVWSDGLGNDNENKIPQCQLTLLFTQVLVLLVHIGRLVAGWQFSQVCDLVNRLSPDETVVDRRLL
jgi:hypothetical protein